MLWKSPIRKGISIPVTTQSGQGFTLTELLVAMAVVALLVVLLLNMVTQTSKTWKSTAGKIEEFRDARIAFDSITRRLGQATLNTYLDYVYSNGVPANYMRQSELRFLSGPMTNISTVNPSSPGLSATTLPLPYPVISMAVFFQAPNGFATNGSNAVLQTALNTWGYFIEYAGDNDLKPSFATNISKTRTRYRLMELMEPTESLSIYNYTSTNPAYSGLDWIANSLTLTSNRPVHLLAENVIALIILPKLSPTDWGTNYTASSLAPNYVYDSSCTNSQSSDGMLNPHNQLPPVIQVTMVAVDETSAIRFSSDYAKLSNTLSSLFTNSSQFSTDLATLGSNLSSNRINYRIFSTDILMKGAKWSSSQTN